MRANNIDSGSEHTQEEDVRGIGNAAVHELNQKIRAEALRRIDEGGFSCATSLSLFLSTPVHRHGAVKLVSF
jgi:hypothetical protein